MYFPVSQSHISMKSTIVAAENFHFLHVEAIFQTLCKLSGQRSWRVDHYSTLMVEACLQMCC